jgi:hypothetical protein
MQIRRNAIRYIPLAGGALVLAVVCDGHKRARRRHKVWPHRRHKPHTGHSTSGPRVLKVVGRQRERRTNCAHLSSLEAPIETAARDDGPQRALNSSEKERPVERHYKFCHVRPSGRPLSGRSSLL